MAPTLAMSLTGSGPAGLIGRAAPLAFAAATVGVLVVASGFVRLSAEFFSAGSVYGFVRGSLGPRSGFVTGWALLGTYLVFPAVSIAGIALFSRAVLSLTGLSADADWFWPALAGWAFVALLAGLGVQPTSRFLLLAEGVSCLLILGVVAAVAVKLGSGTAPRGQSLSLDVVRLPPGTSAATVALGATFGFLAFAGFESAGSLGEESLRPRRAIPRSMLLAITLGGVFYVITMCAQTLGFGTDAAGVQSFASSPTPLADLARTYQGSRIAAALDIAAVLSAGGAALGGVVVGSRMLLTFGRSGLFPPLARTSAGAPRRALLVELAVTLALLTGFRLAGISVTHTFFYLATLGVLSLLVMYAVTDLAAARHLRRRDGLRAAVLPCAGVLVAGYVLVRNVWPVPEAPFDRFPYLVAGWLAAGAALSLRFATPGTEATGPAGPAAAAADDLPAARQSRHAPVRPSSTR
jgi:amino acid transporter